jgi:hypothetical protein
MEANCGRLFVEAMVFPIPGLLSVATGLIISHGPGGFQIHWNPVTA